MKRGFKGVPKPLLPAMLPVATNDDAGTSAPSAAPSQLIPDVEEHVTQQSSSEYHPPTPESQPPTPQPISPT